MGEVSIIGLDLAKNVFQAHGAAADGSVIFRRKLSRAQLLKFMAAQPPCVVAMEACASSHHWGRAIGEAFHSGQGIADGGRERGFSRDRRELHGQPSLQIVEDRGGMGTAKFDPDIRWRTSGLFFDGIELGDPADGFLGNRRALGPVDVDELAPDRTCTGSVPVTCSC